jgi:peptidoglycan/xylan/chitin deacetylase (PgdA/CDA1 family)
MANNGIKFGAHSLSHEVLTNLSAENLKIEIQESKKLIEARLGKEVETFCYPHGMLDERVVRAVQNSGINGAVAGVGANMDYSDTYRLARMYPPGQYKSIFIDSLYRY